MAGVEIVLADENQPETMDGGKIHRLVKVPFLDRAVSKKGHGDFAVFPQFAGERRAYRVRNTGGHDWRGPHDPVLQIDQVHRPAAPSRAPGPLTKAFRDHRTQRASFGQIMPVRSVRSEEVITLLQTGNHSGSYGFLSQIQVHRTANLTRLGEVCYRLFRPPNADHAPVQAQEEVRRQ